MYIARLLVGLNSWSIRSRLLLLVLLGVLPAAALLANLAWEYRTERIEGTSSQALALARMIAGDQEEVLEGARQLMKALAQMRWLRSVERSTCDATLSDLSLNNPRYNAILFIDTSGAVICGSSTSSVDSDILGKEYFGYALTNDDIAAGRMIRSAVDATPVLPFAVRYINSSGDVGGVVFVSLRLDWLGKVVNRLELPASAVLTVTDRDGTVLASRPLNSPPIGQAARWAGELAAPVRTPRLVEAEEKLIGLAPVRDSELYVGIAVPKDAVTATGDELFQLHLLIIGVIASVNLGLAWAVGELSIGRRVRGLTAVGRELRNGNLKARLALPPGGGELQVLQETFDHMAAQIERREDDLRRSADVFRHQALHDELTGLPCRTLFFDRLGQSLARARRDRLSVAVLALDLDNFKDVNDLLGHAAGDLLLIKVAERLRRAVRDCDTVARLGGDEFALSISQISGPREAAEVAERLQAQFKEPFDLKGGRWHTSTSIGIMVSPGDATDVGHLLRCADLALYQAKDNGGGSHSFYARQMKARIQRRKSIEEELRRAIEHNDLVLHYQPQVDLRTGGVVGVEALLRWKRPAAGLVKPDLFLSVAEESGLMPAIGHWTLHTACREAAARIGPNNRVAVNISAAQIWQQGLSADVTRILRSTGLSPGQLVLEITEDVVLHRPKDNISEVLQQLNRTGVGIAWDDFGTGYSSLTHLRNLPVWEIKIDRSFVRALESSKDDAAIVRGVIDLAHSLGIRTVAEGVETAAQAKLLSEFGCDLAQGYYFGRPAPADTLRALLRHRGPSRRMPRLAKAS